MQVPTLRKKVNTILQGDATLPDSTFNVTGHHSIEMDRPGCGSRHDQEIDPYMAARSIVPSELFSIANPRMVVGKQPFVNFSERWSAVSALFVHNDRIKFLLWQD